MESVCLIPPDDVVRRTQRRLVERNMESVCLILPDDVMRTLLRHAARARPRCRRAPRVEAVAACGGRCRVPWEEAYLSPGLGSFDPREGAPGWARFCLACCRGEAESAPTSATRSRMVMCEELVTLGVLAYLPMPSGVRLVRLASCRKPVLQPRRGTLRGVTT